MQEINPDWDFPATVTVNIDKKNITFNAFGDLRTCEYVMNAMNGTIQIGFADFSEDSDDYLGGGEIEFSPDGIKLTVEPESEDKQVYFHRRKK